MELKRSSIWMIDEYRAAQKVRIFQSLLGDLSRYEYDLALQLKSEFLALAGGSVTMAAQKFFAFVYDLINLYPNIDQLKISIQVCAAGHTQVTRIATANAPLIVKSLLT